MTKKIGSDRRHGCSALLQKIASVMKSIPGDPDEGDEAEVKPGGTFGKAAYH